MAGRPQQVTGWQSLAARGVPLLVLAGATLAALLALVVLGVFLALLLAGGGDGGPLAAGYIASVSGFTLWQALLSTALTLLAAVPMARSLARQASFPGRALLVRLCAVPMVMPAIVGIFGVVAVYGGSGYLALAAGHLGFGWRPRIYGLGGILIAHLFFNLPLAVRLLLLAYGTVPAETWRLAAQLGMRDRDVFRIIELPLLRQQLPGIATVVFMLCFTTFAVALTLGGGPKATTLEVAIYQALRFDFDLRLGAALALVQAACCAGGAALLWRWGRQMEMTAPVRLTGLRPDGDGCLVRRTDGALILLGAVFITLPMVALVLKGLAGLAGAAPWPSLLRASGFSIGLGLASGTLATAAGYVLAGARQRMLGAGLRRGAGFLALSGRVGLFVSPMVLGTGMLVAARGHLDLAAPVGAAGAVVGLGVLTALPFALGVLEPAMALQAAHHDRLCAALGIEGWNRFAHVEWPALRRPAASALALSSVIAMGDLGAIALFGNQDMTSLTLLLYNQLGAYRIDGAAGTALILLALAFALYWSIERVAGGRELY